MSDDFGSEDQNESGGKLREKLERALAENAELKTIAVQAKAKELIQTKGYKHVTPTDFDGVSLAEIEAKADALEAQKAEADAEALRRVLRANGIAADDLDGVVKTLVSPSADQTNAEALARIRQLGSVSGEALASQKLDPSQMTPDEKIKASIAARKKK